MTFAKYLQYLQDLSTFSNFLQALAALAAFVSGRWQPSTLVTLLNRYTLYQPTVGQGGECWW